jgi:AcrR family transcriptional regulator
VVSKLTGKIARRTGRRSAQRARQLVADFRRRMILDAARTVFARHGFAGTSVELIADEADVAKGTLYLYFGSKSDIYSAAVTSGLDELTRETTAVLSSGAHLRAVLRAFFETRRRYFEQHVDFFRIYSSEVGNLGQAAAEIRREFVRQQDAQVDALERVIAGAVRAREIRTVNARAVALAVFDLSHGDVLRRLRGDAPPAASDFEQALDLLWKGLAPR